MIIEYEKLTPMMKRYHQIKSEYEDCLLFFRQGDFYEMFFDDAIKASAALDLTLTGRDCGLEKRAPMCGVPYHAVDGYIRRLIDGGFKVAICEQLSDPAASKGLVERGVTRVVTPGTVMEEDILDDKSCNYLASVYLAKNGYGIAWTDISTGEFNLTEYTGDNFADRLSDTLSTIIPAECVSNEAFIDFYPELQFFKNSDLRPRCYHEFAYYFPTAYKKLCSAFGVSTLSAFECDDKNLAVSAAGGLFEYLIVTQKRELRQINKLNCIRDNIYMTLDGSTRRNLELTARARDGKRVGSLLSVLDKTHCAMGARTLKKWIERPLQDYAAINARYSAVEELTASKDMREALGEAYDNVRDLERLCGRLAYGSATPKDLLSISETLNAVTEIKKTLRGAESALLKKLYSRLDEQRKLNAVLYSALEKEKMPAVYGNGGYIAKKFDKQLDALRDIRTTAEAWIRNLENSERESTGIRNLKISSNKIFGYYIEVSNSFLDKVPYRYQRKQTLVGGERFITEELKEIEEKVYSAASDALAIEERIFAELKGMLLEVYLSLQNTAGALAELDALASFAAVSVKNGYVKPVMNKKVTSIKIEAGRHAVVETLLDKGAYVPNDTLLDNADNRTMIITGPNMAGKSTYMRQVALIVLMAHIGCFVPAKSAEIALTDRIFTRIGASDDLTGGQSTFMVEMIEVATILNYATSSSLLILDEIGRGTSTYDGLSIAWAVLEYITEKIKAHTLFATHFHELTDIEELSGVKNYRVLVSENADRIIFLHKIARGSAPKSFGIEVASLAGVAKPVIEHAKRIMSGLERASLGRDTNELTLASREKTQAAQLSLFDKEESKIEAELRDTDVDNLTPLQALTILSDLKKRLTD